MVAQDRERSEVGAPPTDVKKSMSLTSREVMPPISRAKSLRCVTDPIALTDLILSSWETAERATCRLISDCTALWTRI